MMFKRFFSDLCNVNNECSLMLIRQGKPYIKLKWYTVRLYHVLYGTGKEY